MSKYAKYVGSGDVRRMTKAQWAAAGVVDQDTLSWTASNGYTVALDQVSEGARVVLSKDPGIIFTDEEPTPEEIRNAGVEAARSRLIARQAGETVLSATDPIPVSVGASKADTED